jgi:UDP-GlcNAc3NAcA epimerase
LPGDRPTVRADIRHSSAGHGLSIKLVTVVGARPQFIKAAAVSRAIRDGHAGEIDEVLVHTGQHYDDNMSAVFFDELDIPRSKYDLKISGGSHGAMTGRMLEAIESVLVDEKPDWVLVYGDTNSTLAGALAAAKLHMPIAHVEAGLRSFNRRMPEEINRILADRLSSLLFCPTDTAVGNLRAEGMTSGVHNCGDVMYDVALYYRDRARQRSTVLRDLSLTDRGFALATCHRAENTDDPQRLGEVVSALADIARDLPVVLPLHPRTRKLIDDNCLRPRLTGVTVIDPLPFLDMVALEQSAKVILTDSGGIQKEAFFYGVPCVTMRDETEWVETVSLGRNRIVGAVREDIVAAFHASLGQPTVASGPGVPYGHGDAASRILSQLVRSTT